MATLRVFKSTIPSCNYIFQKGKSAAFVNGTYRTANEAEIAELEAEISLGHPNIYIDAAEREIDSELVDPIAALRHKIIADYEAQKAANTNPDRDLGNYTAGAVVPASSRDVAAATANGAVSLPTITAKK